MIVASLSCGHASPSSATCGTRAPTTCSSSAHLSAPHLANTNFLTKHDGACRGSQVASTSPPTHGTQTWLHHARACKQEPQHGRTKDRRGEFKESYCEPTASAASQSGRRVVFRIPTHCGIRSLKKDPGPGRHKIAQVFRPDRHPQDCVQLAHGIKCFPTLHLE